MKCVMVQGVTSGAGKSTVSALLCRHFRGIGLKVAPFKASNLSLNSYVTPEGGEIGMSQAFQAWACGREPEADMNPLLLKPKGEGGCQLIVQGRPYMDVGSGAAPDHHILREAVRDSYHRLAERNDVIVIEGSGSPAEINLRGSDIANMAMAEMADAPVIMVGDIERGGVFAGLYGTYCLLEDRHRPRVKAFLINRFRGDPTILGSGISSLEERMGLPCLGVLPYADLRFPAEDALDLARGRAGRAEGSDIRAAWLENLDAFHRIASTSLDLQAVERMALSTDRAPQR